MKTRYYRTIMGWQAKTELELDNHCGLLKFHTCQYDDSGGLATIAFTLKQNTQGNLLDVRCSVGESQFSRVLAYSYSRKITESLVKKQHESVLERLEAVIQEVRSFYSNQKPSD